MLQSELFTKTRKEAPKDEEAVNARLLIRAGFVDKVMAGVYSFLPLGLLTLKKIENIIREEMNSLGAREILMPVLNPKEAWEKTGRWNTFDALYKVKGKDGREMALGPTHEEIIVPLTKKFIGSYKDLPVCFYQIQTKFRDEPRVKSGLLRSREFLMKDLYSFHSSQKDLDAYYEKMKKVYLRIFRRCGLKVLLTEASGGSFSKYSHEFQALSEAGEDTVYYCKKCGWARNKEIFKGNYVCSKCRAKLEIGRAIEVGNIFKLGAKYSEPFDLKFKTRAGGKETVVMGCYGIGLGRIMGAIVEASHDDRGVVWPEEVAPFRVHLINLKPKTKNLKPFSDRIYNNLRKAGVEVLYDDRKEISAGEKFADADLIGIPWRVVVSEKAFGKNSVGIKKRNESEEKLVKVSAVKNYARNRWLT